MWMSMHPINTSNKPFLYGVNILFRYPAALFDLAMLSVLQQESEQQSEKDSFVLESDGDYGIVQKRNKVVVVVV